MIEIKTCQNCAYRQDNVCARTGYSWKTERRFANMLPDACGPDFHGWAPRPDPPDGILKRCFKRIFRV